MQLAHSEEKTALPTAQLDRAAALEYACRTKVKDMNLGNHRSAYKTLGKLDGRYKESLQRMGYGRRLLDLTRGDTPERQLGFVVA